jgi:C1A family cysteine protease
MYSLRYTASVGLNPVDYKDQTVAYAPSGEDTKVSATSLPTSLDYRTQNMVTSIKNQGTCGCCWSFSSIAMYESQLLKRSFSYGLSEEASLECTKFYSPGNRVSDCSGGYFKDALTFLAAVGSVLRSNYPYIAGSFGPVGGYPYTPGICNETSRIMLGTGKAIVYSNLTVL